jgi:NTP pyrophosphatase (non-canonical NTP hydrolase)
MGLSLGVIWSIMKLHMNQIESLTKIINDFRDARNWRQFHNPKDLAISLSLEAGEVLEHFQWKSPEEIKEYIKENRKEIADELADVFYWVLLMSSDLEVDIEKAFLLKMKENGKKYPVKKAKGKHTKYDEL